MSAKIKTFGITSVRDLNSWSSLVYSETYHGTPCSHTEFCLQSIFMGFAWFSGWTAITSLRSINQLIIVMETSYVFCGRNLIFKYYLDEFHASSKSKFRRLCYQALTTYHPNVSTLILSLSEGRAGIAWEPSNYKMLSPPPEIKCLSLPPPPPQHFLFASTLLLSFRTLSFFFVLQKVKEAIVIRFVARCCFWKLFRHISRQLY
jgi:hypothetical protein